MKRSLLSVSVICGVVAVTLGGVPQAEGAVYDLRTNGTTAVPTAYGTAYFTTQFVKTTGTGQIDPFLTIGQDGTESGYNTSEGVFNTQRFPQWNHELTKADLELSRSTYFGVDYFVFAIDTNEPNGGDKITISLDSFKLYSSPNTGVQATNVDSIGTKLFEMNAGDFVFYYDANSGSGQGDFAVFVPVSAFAGVGLNDKIYMYQAWGGNNVGSESGASGGGYEETRLGIGIRIVPEPSALIPLAGVLGFALTSRRLIRRRP